MKPAMRRSWLETRVQVRAEVAELAGAILVELGSPGLVDEGGAGGAILIAYFDRPEQLEEVRRRLAGIAPEALLTVREISEEDWAGNWKAHFPRLDVGTKLVLCPPWDAAPSPERLVLVIDPGMAFGTGQHATTRASLELLESCELAGADVLDVGTGSGVLAIAALRLGARHAVGVDIDPVALEAATANAACNGVADRFAVVDSLDATRQTFDLAMANLQLNTLLELEPAMAQRVRAGGTLIASGLLREDMEAWRRAYAENWIIGESAGDQQWAAVKARRRKAARHGGATTGARPRVRLDAGEVRDGTAVITGAELHHLRVRRLRPGDEVVGFDANGNEYAARVRSLSADAAVLDVGAATRPVRESQLRLKLAQAVLKGDHLDLVIEKTTEIGVDEIVLFDCERSLARPSKARLERLARIAESAAKQSGRVEVPTIRGPLAFGDILSPGALLFHPLSGARLEHALGGQATLTVIVGPEGGFAPAEIDAALAAGCRLVGLGPRVLRAETAAVVVCGLCQYLWGDLGPIESD